LAGEAVVADHAVGDEVAGTGSDVEKMTLTDRLDRPHPELRVALQGNALDRALASDRGVA
jgi:hypothetical protein